jgi:uncharacterized cupredoxin-like copper-binding protein
MIRIRIVGVAVASALVILLAAPVAGARSTAATATTVTVKMKEFKFILSRKTVPRGKVTFIVVNVGHLKHDFKIKGKKTATIAPGKRTKLVVTFPKKGSFPYLCVTGQHYKYGMKGTLKVT